MGLTFAAIVVCAGLIRPVDIKPYEGKLLIAEQGGGVSTCDPKDGKVVPLFKLPVLYTEDERGLLSIEPFNNGFLVFYSTDDKIPGNSTGYDMRQIFARNVLARVSKKGEVERVLTYIPRVFTNHNGGHIQRHKGKIYLSTGDGGGDAYAWGVFKRERNPSTLGAGEDESPNGKILQIDEAEAARDPKDSRDFVRVEVFAKGFRNPWKMSFTPDGRLIVADVGHVTADEINDVVQGGNYGWPRWEGNECVWPPCQPAIGPIHRWNAAEKKGGACAVGGYVVGGLYYFGNCGQGDVWSLDLSTKKAAKLGTLGFFLSSFGLLDGVLYAADYLGGNIRKLSDAGKP